MVKPNLVLDELEFDETLEELSQRPNISNHGTVTAGTVTISTTSCTFGGKTLTLDPAELMPMEGTALGRGSSGSVKRMQHKSTGKVMAVKEIKISSQHHMSEIQKELETLHQGVASQHKNLIEFYGAYAKEGCVYIAMECMDGSLASFRSVPEDVLAKMTKQILEGLVYLHRIRHLIHRDIKPSNVLYSDEGLIKITDFGVSSQIDTTRGSAVSFVGTVTYMSPERLNGDAHGSVGDIWSLGISLCEMALGVHPYQALLVNENGEKNDAKFWSLLSHLNSGNKTLNVPENASTEFTEFMSLCCAKDPTKRANAGQLLEHAWISKFCRTFEQDTEDIKAYITSAKKQPQANGQSQGVAAQSQPAAAKAPEKEAQLHNALDDLLLGA